MATSQASTVCRMRTSARACACIHTGTHTHERTHEHTHTCEHTHIHTHKYIHKHADLRASWSAVGTKKKDGVTVIMGWDRQPGTGPSDAPQLTRQPDVYSRERVCITLCMNTYIHPYVCANLNLRRCLCMFVCMFVYTYTNMYSYIRLLACMHMSMFRVSVRACLLGCMYTSKTWYPFV